VIQDANRIWLHKATLAGAGTIVGGLAAVGVSAPVALTGLFVLGVQYSVIDSRRQERTERINRLERETAGLKGTLAELATHAQSFVSGHE
jgi:hypothetical protein